MLGRCLLRHVKYQPELWFQNQSRTSTTSVVAILQLCRSQRSSQRLHRRHLRLVVRLLRHAQGRSLVAPQTGALAVLGCESLAWMGHVLGGVRSVCSRESKAPITAALMLNPECLRMPHLTERAFHTNQCIVTARRKNPSSRTTCQPLAFRYR